MDAQTERRLFDFIAHEARLLDAQRFDEWLALFADNGRYWVPLRGGAQADDGSHNALADEDRLLLALRIERLKSPRAHSQHPPSSCQHILQQPALVHGDARTPHYELRTPFVYIEVRGERQLMLAGCYRHRLIDRPGGLRIELKRVDLLNPGATLPAIQLFP
ncbi:aromatic-ring-hydroxylating dioxygenase subunit beta [Rhodoferax sediminis]|uniref:Aromatic-ring-hydroxylating dioxygenase subunit beta n=1 Tax=Rhodoferax sediminis TaxID=2509614 RepID=A0A515DA39_9BURK|nr:aromatic-ring-hydroxylating dioxygenase subunit beta [Rhodoferax sediminis]QDL37259.1 aromatic-ring-hydroxylating dioxygenase subunit beta [Rhodoferax sediminis]